MKVFDIIGFVFFMALSFYYVNKVTIFGSKCYNFCNSSQIVRIALSASGLHFLVCRIPTIKIGIKNIAIPINIVI